MNASAIQKEISAHYTYTVMMNEDYAEDEDLLSNSINRYGSVQDCILRSDLGYFIYLLGEIFEPPLTDKTDISLALEFLFREEILYIARNKTISSISLNKPSIFQTTDELQLWVNNSLEKLHIILSQQYGVTNTANIHSQPIILVDLFPEDTKWEDVVIEINTHDHITIKVGEKSKRCHYAELGFKDGRKGDQPTLIWRLLINMLGKNGGKIGWETDVEVSERDRNKIKKYISELRGILRNISGLTENPFHSYKKSKAYVVKFKLRDKRDGADEPQNLEHSQDSTQQLSEASDWKSVMSHEELVQLGILPANSDQT